MADDFDFDPEFESIVEYFEQIQEEEQRRGTVRLLNPIRINEMRNALLKITEIVKESTPGAKIEYGIDQFSGGGYITINSPDALIMKNMGRFHEAFEKLSNCEIQITKGKIQINFMVYGVTKTQLLPE